jgi:hypothetical protein
MLQFSKIFPKRKASIYFMNTSSQIKLILKILSSSVSIATDYGLHGWGSIPEGTRFLSSSQPPDRLWAHPASYPMGTGGSFPGGKTTGA